MMDSSQQYIIDKSKGNDNDQNWLPLRLRFDYTNLERISPLSKQIEERQNDCTTIRKKRGMACAVLEIDHAQFRTIGSWIYNDVQKCHHSNTTGTSSTIRPNAPMSCYFPQAEPDCDADNDDRNSTTGTATHYEQFSISYMDITGSSSSSCPRITDLAGGHSNVRAAMTEYLFTRVSDIVQEEGERQLNVLFGTRNTTTTTTTNTKRTIVPNNLITVHIRWGDKGHEMKFIPIHKYIDAVQQILYIRKKKKWIQFLWSCMKFTNQATTTMMDKNDTDDDNTGVHILLATEDPEAMKQFMSIKPKHWNVYVDQYYYEMLPYRMKVENVFIVNTLYSENKDIQGRNGLIALGSLLVAMEATDYVLTTASNWSRLINEIRKNIIDPRCNHCTSMIDLLYDEI